jgi:hypothetical protein
MIAGTTGEMIGGIRAMLSNATPITAAIPAPALTPNYLQGAEPRQGS